jgi:hypothetical protein
VQLNEHIAEPGDVVFHHACKLGFEGIVSKRPGSRYRTLSLPQKGRQVLEPDLNCSESAWGAACASTPKR